MLVEGLDSVMEVDSAVRLDSRWFVAVVAEKLDLGRKVRFVVVGFVEV